MDKKQCSPTTGNFPVAGILVLIPSSTLFGMWGVVSYKEHKISQLNASNYKDRTVEIQLPLTS